MRIKIIYIIKCSSCPFFEIDPNNEIEFWGKNVCMYDIHNLREIDNENTIPDWCELQDKEQL